MKAAQNSPLEVLRVFLRLGLTSFGGPVAHLGYFRNAFVVRTRLARRSGRSPIWSRSASSCPGPASSQVGFAIGLMRAGYPGALAAWAGFTLPSAIAMTLFAYGAGALSGPAGEGLLHGLKLVAVAVSRRRCSAWRASLAPDRPRAAIAVLALILVAFAPGGVGQIGAIVAGGLLGLVFCREGAGPPPAAPRRAGLAPHGAVFLAAFFALLALSCLPACGGGAWPFWPPFYRSGALVFGGGHVVLPLLRAAVVDPGLVSRQRVSRRLWRGAGDARPALHFRRLSRRGRAVRPAAWPARRWRWSRSSFPGS